MKKALTILMFAALAITAECRTGVSYVYRNFNMDACWVDFSALKQDSVQYW